MLEIVKEWADAHTINWLLNGANFVVLALLVSGVFYWRAEVKRNNKSAELATTPKPLQEALDSDDLRMLGSYLVDTLGKVTVAQYARHPARSKIVDHHLIQIQKYVAVDGDATAEKDAAAEKKDAADVASPAAEPGAADEKTGDSDRGTGALQTLDVPPEVQSAYAQLQSGEVWNSLARLRRNINKHLYKIAEQLDPTLAASEQRRRILGVSQLTRRLLGAGRLAPRQARNIRNAVSICNRAVHGEDVSYEEAQRAFAMASEAYKELGLSAEGKSGRSEVTP
jgi:hypothetical protein